MPSGYTADIAKGISFEQFALGCARAFGATISMRDEPLDAPIPERFEPSSHASKRLEETKAKLATLEALTPAECGQNALEEYEQALEEQRQRQLRRIDMLAKYNDMLAQVQAWEPPSQDHVELKRFMTKQIEESMQFDCMDLSGVVEKLSGEQWLAQSKRSTLASLEYYEKTVAEEIERANSRTRWVWQLRESLKSHV